MDDILAKIPAHSTNHRVLSLCFVDPFDIGIKFETLRKLSERYMDFLVLLALYMDAPAKVRFLSIEPLLEDIGAIDLSGISWVIVGGESGPGARPMKKEWVVSIRRQCRAYGVPFFFKQWGGVRKVKHGRELDGRTYDEYPRRVLAPVPDRIRCAAFAENFLNSFRGMIAGTSLVQVGA